MKFKVKSEFIYKGDRVFPNQEIEVNDKSEMDKLTKIKVLGEPVKQEREKAVGGAGSEKAVSTQTNNSTSKRTSRRNRSKASSKD